MSGMSGGQRAGRCFFLFSFLSIFILISWIGAVVSPLAVEPAKMAESLYQQARFDVLDEEYEAALAKLDEALQLMPLDFRVIYLKAKILKLLDRQDEALAFFLSLLDQDPKNYAVLRFDAGYVSKDLGNFEAAMEQFRLAEAVDFLRALREEGWTLMQMKEYDQAVEAFGRVGEEAPQVRQEFLFLASQALFHKGDLKAVKDYLARALVLAPDSNLVPDIISFQQMTDARVRAERPWSVVFTSALQYDGNVYLNTLESNPTADEPRQEGDASLLLGGNFSYRLGAIEGVVYGLSGQVQRLDYFTEEDSNFAYWSMGAFLSRAWAKMGFSLPYSFSYFYATADLEDRLVSHTIAPSFYWLITPKFRTGVNALFQERYYFDGSPDVFHFGLGVSHLITLAEPTQYLRVSYRYDRDKSDDDLSGYDAYEITMGGGFSLWGPISIDAGLTAAYYVYDPRPGLYGTTQPVEMIHLFVRRDNQVRFALQATYRTGPRWSIMAGYFLTTNDSNVEGPDGYDPFRFSKSVVSLMLVWMF